jgi:ABC-type dipeptide/oligopeptide/nickel transport system ATPase component
MSSLYYRFDKEKKKWDIIPASDKLPSDIKLCPNLIKTLDHVKEDLHKDRDVGIIIFGGVGSGKSTLGRLCCRYVSDENFNPRNNMVRDVNDIAPIMKKVKKYQGLVFDEASGIFGSTDTNTKKTKYAQLVLDVCRQKNLFLVIIAPQFHRLTAPVALDRTEFALRTYFTKGNKRRGNFCFYGTKAKAILYEYAKKNHGNIKVPRLKKRYGEFGDDIMFKDEYVKLKDETLNLVLDSFSKPKEKKLRPQDIEMQYKEKIIKQNLNRPVEELSTLFGVSKVWIYKLKKRIVDEYKEKALVSTFVTTEME